MNVILEILKYRSILLSHSNQASQQHEEQKQEWNLTPDECWVLLVDSLWSATKTKVSEGWWSKPRVIMSTDRRENHLLGNGGWLQPQVCRCLTAGSAPSQGPAGGVRLRSAARAASEHQLCFLVTHPALPCSGVPLRVRGTNSTGIQSKCLWQKGVSKVNTACCRGPAVTRDLEMCKRTWHWGPRVSAILEC